MEEPHSQTRRLTIEAGRTVILHSEGRACDFPLIVPVDAVSEDAHWFQGSIDPVRRGETLLVEHAVSNDARYATRGVLVMAGSERFALRLDPLWQRIQQRAFVRISAHGLDVRVVRPTSSTSDADGVPDPDHDLHDLIDVSAGGLRFAAEGGFEIDEEIVCHFELPGSLCFVLPARVVRAPARPAGDAEKGCVAAEFAGLDETHRSQLLRWVYREQVQRHRESARIEQKARRLADGRSEPRR